jgi:two-component system, cell cycle sensor histidine kinase and response regulator CckA
MEEPHRSDEALRESEERFRGAFYYSPIGIGIVALDGRFLRVNPALCRIGGYTEQELLSMSFQDVVPPDELAFHRAQARRLIEREIDSYEREVRYRHKQGHFVWVRFTVSAIHGPGGEIVHLLGQAEDISARREAEERLRQAERLEALGRLAGGVAHEFNNLLAIVGGFARHALARAESQEQRRDLTEIIDAADRAGEISRQLLVFSRDEPSRPTVLDVNEVVRAIEPMLHSLVREDVDVSLSLAEELRQVHVDRAQLERVVVNLVLNARDAIRGGGRIDISTKQVEVRDNLPLGVRLDRGAYVALSVCDTGRGIDPEARARLFDPFFTTKEQGQGAGLGLSAVYGIVERFDGAVVVESEPGEGARFTVFIPSVVEAGQPEAATTEEPEGGEGETILVVEDEVALRALLELILTEAGYRVLTASDGADALAQLEQAETRIDLVITDAIMPRLSGAELVSRLGATRPDTRVLRISGYSDHGFGGKDFIAKPFDPDVLLARVRELIDRPPEDR